MVAIQKRHHHFRQHVRPADLTICHFVNYAFAIIILTIVSIGFATVPENGNGETFGQHPVVCTKLGYVRGTTYDAFNLSVNVFWSIPFAKPPIGQLRFQHPVKKEPWSGVLDTTQKPNACYQVSEDEAWHRNTPESEDCLFLTLYVPSSAPVVGMDTSTGGQCAGGSAARGDALPVMFFIFGGGYVSGASTRYNGSALALLNNVIVVTINYRLGAFGFLYSGTTDAPGNAAVFDQLMALQWVHDNVECFGGDPEAVTVFGGSVGAFSTGNLILSPLSHGLFSRAILMSGTPNSFVGVLSSRDSLEIVEKLGNFIGCHQSSIEQVAQCLKELPAEALDSAQKSVYTLTYGPLIDRHFFPKQVTELYEEAIKKNVTVVLGVTASEGGMLLSFVLERKFAEFVNISLSYEDLKLFVEKYMYDFYSLDISPYQRAAIHYGYTNWENIHDEEHNQLIAAAFVGDTILVCPAVEFGNQLSGKGLNVHFYEFNHRPSNSMWPEWAGVAHGDDIDFIFGLPLDLNNGYTEEEYRLSYRIMKTFGNFAKFGVPTFEEESWPLYKSGDRKYVKLNINGTEVKHGNPRATHCALWNELLPKLIEESCRI